MLSGSTELGGEAQISASSKGALRGEAAKRSPGSTRGGIGEQLLHKTISCAENVGFRSHRATLRSREASGWFSGGSSDVCGCPFWQMTGPGKVSSETQMTEWTSVHGFSRYVFC